MTFNKPENANYCCTVVSIKNIIPLAGCDNVVGTTIFGFQAIVGKDTEIGELGVVFPAETQLSEDYCKFNNLYRHEKYNTDHLKKGYLEDNRRIKAIKFRSHTSNCLFMPLESLKPFCAIEKLQEGDEFDEIDGVKICNKYFVPSNRGTFVPQAPKERRVDLKFFPEHFSTDNYFKNQEKINGKDKVIITQKLHGTSIRIAHTLVKRKLSLVEKVAKFLGANVKETEFSYVFGSKHVIKDPNDPDQKHYYDNDIWNLEGKKLEGLVPENFILFGELIGWTPDGKAIQQDYTYRLPKGTCELYLYRVAFLNEKGLMVDLSWDQVKQFCSERGLNYVPEIWQTEHEWFKVESYLDKCLKSDFKICLPTEEGTVDEGVCVRIDGLIPKIYKAKSPLFFERESKMLDKGEIDLETSA